MVREGSQQLVRPNRSRHWPGAVRPVQQLHRPPQPHRGAQRVRRVALVPAHPVAGVVVGVRERAGGGHPRHLRVRGGTLHVHDAPIAVREDRVVRGGSIRSEGHCHRLVQGGRGQLLPDHQQPRHAHPLVVGRQLVPGQGQPRRVPAHADPGPDAQREHHGLAGHMPLDCDHGRLRGGREVVVVRDPDVAVGRGRWRRDEVAAPPVHR